MIANFLKRNSLILIFVFLYLIVVAMVLLVVDKHYYQSRKREIIKEESHFYIYSKIGEERLNRLMQDCERWARGAEALRSDIRNRIRDIVSDENNIWRLVVKPELRVTQELPGREQSVQWERDQIEYQRREKLEAYNDFGNSLILRDFSGVLERPITEAPGRTIGRILFYYTSPRHDAQIMELSRRYRWYSSFIVIVLTLLAGSVAGYLLLPLRNVMNALEGTRSARTVFLRRPRSRLEVLYNRMALDAVFARLQGLLREEINQRPQLSAWEAINFTCTTFCNQMVWPPLVICLEVAADAPGNLMQTGQRIISGHRKLVADEDQLVASLWAAMPADARSSGSFILSREDYELVGALQVKADPGRSGVRYVFGLALDADTDESAFTSQHFLLGRLVDLVEAGLQSLSFRNQLLVQERGRANINLSRNLGHDLTNIIATSKLDLLAIERLIGEKASLEHPRRKNILSQSMQGLLRSVRFMQETVNLYRAYAFLHQPILEVQDGNELVSETMALFAMYTSARVHLLRELNEEAPHCRVDSRLFKLALFNLFTNALEAIRRKQEQADPNESWIKVVTGRSDRSGLIVEIQDGGTGILNAEGHRATPLEIEKIFEMGYTSRQTDRNAGEGLGLNWVRTIVEHLHQGRIRAENLDRAGARIILEFPPVTAERVGEAAERPSETTRGECLDANG